MGIIELQPTKLLRILAIWGRVAVVWDFFTQQEISVTQHNNPHNNYGSFPFCENLYIFCIHHLREYLIQKISDDLWILANEHTTDQNYDFIIIAIDECLPLVICTDKWCMIEEFMILEFLQMMNVHNYNYLMNYQNGTKM